MTNEDIPEFDPSKPAEPVQEKVPEFDPSKPSEPVEDPYSLAEDTKALVEGGLSGATGGFSEKAQTKLHEITGGALGSTYEDIAHRKERYPLTSTVGNIAGAGALITATGGLGAAVGVGAESGLVARLGVLGAEAFGFGASNKISDDWSQNKPLDAQKILAAGGNSALWGLGAGATLEGIQRSGLANKLAAKFGKVPSSVEKAAVDAEEAQAAASGPVPKEYLGVQDTNLGEVTARNAESLQNGKTITPSEVAEFEDAASRVPMQTPFHNLDKEMIANKEVADIIRTAQEIPGNKLGEAINTDRALKKIELVNKTEQAIQDIAPGSEITHEPYQGGVRINKDLTEIYQTEAKEAGEIIGALKKLPIKGDLTGPAIAKMTETMPEIAQMFIPGKEIQIKPTWNSTWGIAKSTYEAVKQTVESLKDSGEHTLATLWNARKGFDTFVDIHSRDAGAAEIRGLKAGLTDLLEETSGSDQIRSSLRRYAINEGNREVIEDAFKASAGRPELGQLSKVSPELIQDAIFRNSAAVEAAKNIFSPAKFDSMLANYMARVKFDYTKGLTGKGAFSAAKFNTFLKSNLAELGIAFRGKEGLLQNFKDYGTLMSTLPEAPIVNPSRTGSFVAKVLGAAGKIDLKDLSVGGMLGLLPKKIAQEFIKSAETRNLNSILSQTALKTAQENALKGEVKKISGRIELGVKSIFATEAGKEGRNYGK